jgi:hypothetical protein
LEVGGSEIWSIRKVEVGQKPKDMDGASKGKSKLKYRRFRRRMVGIQMELGENPEISEIYVKRWSSGEFIVDILIARKLPTTEA